MKRKILWGATIVALFIILATSANELISLNNRFDYFKSEMSGLSGVKFGDSQQEILYSLGKPDMVSKDGNSSSKSPLYDLKQDDNIENYLTWDYLNNKKVYISIEFEPDSKTVYHISCLLLDSNASMSLCQTISGISPGKNPNAIWSNYNSSEDYIIKMLGKPDREDYRTVNNINQKLLTYDTLGLTFIMIGKQIYSIHKYYTTPDFSWWLFNKPVERIF